MFEALAFVLLAAAFVFGGWRGRVGILGGGALLAGFIVAWASVLLLRDTALLWVAPLPVGSESRILFAVSAFAAVLLIIVWLLPGSAARFAPLAVLAPLTFLLWSREHAFGAPDPTLPMVGILVGVVLPRTVALAAAERTLTLSGGAAGTVLGLAALPAIGTLVLMFVFSPGLQHAEWSVTVQPNASGHYELWVPFLTANDSMVRPVLDGLHASVVATGSNASVRPAPQADGFVLSADGPATLSASYAFVGASPTLFSPGAVQVDSAAWRHDGPGIAFVAWSFGRGCGDQLGESLWVDGAGRADPPQAPSLTAQAPETSPPTAPTPRPCYHGD